MRCSASCQTETTPNYPHIKAELDELQVVIDNPNTHEGSRLEMVKRTFQMRGIDMQARHEDCRCRLEGDHSRLALGERGANIELVRGTIFEAFGIR